MSYDNKSSTNDNEKEKFWINDFRVLYINNNYLKFFPTIQMTQIEQLNALTRFFIYYIIIILIFNMDEKLLYFPITLIFLIVIFYIIFKSNHIRQKKNINSYTVSLNDNNISNNKPNDKMNNSNQPKYTIDELVDYQNNTCRRPSIDNPFMNPSLVDYNNGDPPKACNIDDDEIKDDIRINFNHELFRDIDDIWERKNSQRQFYTVPNTSVPNNQVEFAKWLYLTPGNCKTNTEKCLRWEDLRFRGLVL